MVDLETAVKYLEEDVPRLMSYAEKDIYKERIGLVLKELRKYENAYSHRPGTGTHPGLDS